jgi:hypothetical protein
VKKRLHTQNGLSAKKGNAIACKAGKHGNIKLAKKAIKCKQGKHEKEKKICTSPVLKRLRPATQTPLMALCMSWNRVKGSFARKDLHRVQSEPTIREIKSTLKILTQMTSKILTQMMITKCLLQSAVKN